MRTIKRIFIEFVAQFLAPCNVITRLLSESKERSLTIGERLKLKSHLQFCQWCTDFGHQISIVDQAVKSQKTPHQEHKLSESARQKIKDAMSKNPDL